MVEVQSGGRGEKEKGEGACVVVVRFTSLSGLCQNKVPK